MCSDPLASILDLSFSLCAGQHMCHLPAEDGHTQCNLHTALAQAIEIAVSITVFTATDKHSLQKTH